MCDHLTLGMGLRCELADDETPESYHLFLWQALAPIIVGWRAGKQNLRLTCKNFIIEGLTSSKTKQNKKQMKQNKINRQN